MEKALLEGASQSLSSVPTKERHGSRTGCPQRNLLNVQRKVRRTKIPHRYHGRVSSPENDYYASCDRTSGCLSERNVNDYVTANCQLVIGRSAEAVCVFGNPDAILDWTNIQEVRCYQNEESTCPICLYPPVAPRTGPCGHVYCYPCVQYFIHYENTTGCKKCAVCNSILVSGELKRACILPSKVPNKNETIEFTLMRRLRNAMFPVKFADSLNVEDMKRSLSSSLISYSRIVTVSTGHIRQLVHRDIVALKTLVEDSEGIDETMVPIAKELISDLYQELKSLKSSQKVSNEVIQLDQSDFDRAFTYYMAVTGRDIYLHSVNWRCLNVEYETSHLPLTISGQIIDVECHTMDAELRRRYRYLSHLPIGRTFYFVEIDLQPPVISNLTFEKMSDVLTERLLQRQYKEMLDISLTQAKEEAENQLPSLPPGARLVGHAPLERTIPTDDDFVPLSVAVRGVRPSVSKQPKPIRSFADVSRSGAADVVDRNRVANFTKRSKGPTYNAAGDSSWWDAPDTFPSYSHPPPDPSLTATFQPNVIRTEEIPANSAQKSASRRGRRNRNRNKKCTPTNNLEHLSLDSPVE